MMCVSSCIGWILGFIIVLSSLGMILVKKPVHSCLCFLSTLIALAAVYLQINAPFLAMMQILVYAGAILVIFMFVIVLFQDAHAKIATLKPGSRSWLLLLGSLSLIAAVLWLEEYLTHLSFGHRIDQSELGSAHSLGMALYTEFFFPFEALSLLFLIAVVGALYIGKKVS